MKHKLLEATVDSIGAKTQIENFYPLTTKFDKSEKVFSFAEVTGLFVSKLSNTVAKNFDLESFKKQCLSAFSESMDDTTFIDMIERIYFEEDKFTIDSLFVYQTIKAKTNSKNVFKLFEQLLDVKSLNIDFTSDSNFMDKIVIEELKKHLKSTNTTESTSSYLPYIDKLFNKDLQSLSSNKHYFKQNIEKFFETYFFIYASQLALNLIPNRNALSSPESRELYFILTHEKASTERTKVVEKGYAHLFDSVKYIFPYMSLLTSISNSVEADNLRLYELLEKLDDTQSSIEAVDSFALTFREAKKLSMEEIKPSTSLEEALFTLFDLSFDQFKEGCVVDRKRAFNQYESAFKRQIAKQFIVNRKRAGNVLVLDQDTILFITNLILGSGGKIRFQHLIEEFNERGIYFDAKTRNELIVLFERVGNIERKSDSGDSVYVKATI